MVARYFFILLVLGLLLPTIAHGQRRKVTEAEIDTLIQKSVEARKGLAYRVTNTKLTVFDSPSSQPEVRAVSITEYLPPDRSYTIVEREGPAGTSLGRSETIRIGDKRFWKQPNGEWKLMTPQAAGGDGSGTRFGSGSGNGPGVKTEPPKIKLECEYMGLVEIKGVPVDLYQKVRTVIFSTSKGQLTRIATKKYWFDKKGMLVREVSDDESANATRLNRTVIEYEYDPNIKIEAPIE